MDECTHFFDQMQDLRCRSLDDEQRQALFRHLATCARCRELFDFHADLSAAGERLDDTPVAALAEVRRRVLEQIEEGVDGAEGRGGSWAAFRPARRRLLAVAAAVALVAVGLVLGRSTSGAPAWQGEPLVAALDEAAVRHSSLLDVENSSLLVSDVSVRPVSDGRFELAFNASRHVELTRGVDDPLVKELLVYAILDRSSLGSRLRAVSLADTSADSKVREALLFAMVNDPSLPVRLRALETVAMGAIDDPVRDALVRVLEQDESMQMRLLAVELLAEDETQQQKLLQQVLEVDEVGSAMTGADLISVIN